MTTDAVALVLRHSGAVEDKTLIQKVVALDPQSPWLWLALASYGKLRPQEQTLARATFQNTKLSELNRVYVAVALAPSDEKVAAYVVQEFRNSLVAVDKIDILKVTEEGGRLFASAEPEAQEKLRELGNVMEQHFESLKILNALRYLQHPAAQNLIFTAVAARDMGARKLGTLVAIERFPARFLPLLDRKRYPAEYPDLYENLCAVFVLWHPQYKGQILKNLPATKLNAAIKRIQSQTLHSIFNGFF
jgi:hypothetical protein